ncbi:tetrathionate reductase subunit B, partial [Salmonella enterica subsp. enterica serovar Enteritidis str. 13183-1]
KIPTSRIATHASSASRRYQGIKAGKRTRRPTVFYLGLDDAFVTPLMGRAQPALWQEV